MNNYQLLTFMFYSSKSRVHLKSLHSRI